MKLIDAEEYDSLLREYRNNPGLMFGIQRARNLLKKQRSVDAVPVVRCRECKFRDGTPGQPNILCGNMHDDDFCSYGERKEGAD